MSKLILIEELEDRLSQSTLIYYIILSIDAGPSVSGPLSIDAGLCAAISSDQIS